MKWRRFDVVMTFHFDIRIIIQSYVGQFVEDKRCGKGKYAWNTGAYYDGEFADDKKEGYGIFVFPNGNRFEV